MSATMSETRVVKTLVMGKVSPINIPPHQEMQENNRP